MTPSPDRPQHDPNLWRTRFPILRETSYLVNHSLGAMPATAVDKLNHFTEQWATRGVRAWSEGWWDSPMIVGNLLGKIMNAPEGTVVMHQNVSVIQSIVGSALDFSGTRNKIVYTDQNFPTNMYVWEGYRDQGARIHSVESDPGGGMPIERLLEAIDEETLLVPVSHVLFRSSYLQDAAAICERAREVGALVLLDCYQSLGTVPIDVQALDVDMVCGGSVKWLCGGPGAAYLYVKPEVSARLKPRITGWAAHAEPFAFELGAQRYAEGIARFLHGTPGVACLAHASAGYEVVQEVGLDAIRSWSIFLNESLRQDLLERGFTIFGPTDPERRGGTLTVELTPEESGPAFVSALASRGILIDHRPDAGLRVSPHFYTRQEELQEFAEILAKLRTSGSWRDHLEDSGAY